MEYKAGPDIAGVPTASQVPERGPLCDYERWGGIPTNAILDDGSIRDKEKIK